MSGYSLMPSTSKASARIVASYYRPLSTSPPVSSDGLRLHSGRGIEGDCHWSAISPRQVLIACTGSYSRLAIGANSLRENILVDCERIDWPSGTQLAIGGSAVLRIMFACEPCAKLNRIRQGLTKESFMDRGVLARVVSSGRIRIGDCIALTPKAFPVISDNWRERVLNVLDSIPPGRSIEFRMIARVAGVHRSFCRTFPSLIRSRTTGLALGAGMVSRFAPPNASGEVLPWEGDEFYSERPLDKHQSVASV
jgi:hypothetical protein